MVVSKVTTEIGRTVTRMGGIASGVVDVWHAAAIFGFVEPIPDIDRLTIIGKALKVVGEAMLKCGQGLARLSKWLS